jgi:hypothetical protein
MCSTIKALIIANEYAQGFSDRDRGRTGFAGAI